MGSPILNYQPGGGVPIWVGPPPVIPPTPPDSGGTGISDAGVTPLVNGQSYIDVVFDIPQSNNSWIFVELDVVNTTDTTPLNIWPGIITVKTSTGFRLQLNGLPDSANYLLHWAISGVALPVVAATTYSFAGPTTGAVGAPKTYTVQLPTGTTVASPVTVTPSDIGGGGAFSPTSVILTTVSPSATFTYTPGTVGMKTLAVTNSGALTDPSSIAFNATAFSTNYTLTGPSSGIISTASTNFTVALPVGGTLASPVTVTPSDGGAGGTFTPTNVTISTGTTSATFTYTPSSYGNKTISTTNGGSLTDPASLTYTSLASTYTSTGPSSGTVSTPSSNFTVALPAGGAVIGTVTVTPSDSSGGGTFTPTTVNLTTGAPSATFTYTPGSTGAKTISVTNSGGLTNPGSLTYTSNPAGLADGSPVSTWLDSSGNGHHATMTGSNRPTFKTAIVNGNPVVRFTSAGQSKLNLASAISGAGNFTSILVAKPATGTDKSYTLTGNGVSATPMGPILVDGGGAYIFDRVGYVPCASLISLAWHVLTGTTSSGSKTLYLDGTSDTDVPAALASVGDFVAIGYDSVTPTYFNSDIAEIIFYNVFLSSTDRANIEKYLGTKYGVTVAGGSAVDPSTVTGLAGWWKADLGVS